MKVLIIMADSNGGYPVPASKGGAVSTLINHLVDENEKNKLVDLEIISIYDKKAEEMSSEYKNTTFRWVKPPKIFVLLDSILFFIVRKSFKKKKNMSYKSLFSLAYTILFSTKVLKNEKYDKVILENNIPLAWCIKLSKYQGDYYYHFHNVPRINAKCKEIFQNCKNILCVSDFVAKEIQKQSNPIGPIKKDKTKVLYNCIDLDQFKPLLDLQKRTTIREKYGLSSDDKIICFVGRLSEEKGIDKVLEAFLKTCSKNLKLLIVGSYIHNSKVVDDYQLNLYKMADNYKEKIIFTGYIPQSQVQEVYQCSDIAVLPSMWDEPAGLTMVEALACGIPVITTNSGGIPEYMGNKAIVIQRDDDLIKNISLNIDNIIKNKTYIPQSVNEFSKENYLLNFVDLLMNE